MELYFHAETHIPMAQHGLSAALNLSADVAFGSEYSMRVSIC